MIFTAFPFGRGLGRVGLFGAGGEGFGYGSGFSVGPPGAAPWSRKKWRKLEVVLGKLLTVRGQGPAVR